MLDVLGLEDADWQALGVAFAMALAGFFVALSAWLGWQFRPHRRDPVAQVYGQLCRRLARHNLARRIMRARTTTFPASRAHGPSLQRTADRDTRALHQPSLRSDAAGFTTQPAEISGQPVESLKAGGMRSDEALTPSSDVEYLTHAAPPLRHHPGCSGHLLDRRRSSASARRRRVSSSREPLPPSWRAWLEQDVAAYSALAR